MMTRLFLAGALTVMLAACSDSSSPTAKSAAEREASADGGASVPDAGAPDPFPNTFAKKALSLADGGLVVVAERPQSLRVATPGPTRELVWIDAAGVVRARREAQGERAVLDAAVHPSGEVTALVASQAGFALVRYAADGAPREPQPFVDSEIVNDLPAIKPSESRAPIEAYTHDVGRIDADGEGVVLATRTGRHSVIAYRVGFDPATGFTTKTRALVVPAHDILPVGLTGGTYDTFAQLVAPYVPHIARAANGTLFVAVQHARAESGEMIAAHEAVFGETLVTDPDGLDIFVTRLDGSGVRIATSVVGTAEDDQLYGLRAIGDDAYALGRTEHWNEEGTGFDALVGRVATDGSVTVREVAIDRGDVAFDIAPAEGGLVVVGASGYAQNPHGASITEESKAFAAWLPPAGAPKPLALVNGARHNEARFVFPRGTQLLVGGMHDGPGTHSADGDARLIRARGFLATLTTR